MKLPWGTTPTHPPALHTLSVLGRDKGYTVKYSPLPEGTPEGGGLYSTVYPESSPNMGSI